VVCHLNMAAFSKSVKCEAQSRNVKAQSRDVKAQNYQEIECCCNRHFTQLVKTGIGVITS
jgi:hypothetical protein